MTILQCRTKLLTKVHILFCIKLAEQYRTETDRTDEMKRGVRTVGEVRRECRCNYNTVSNNRSCRKKHLPGQTCVSYICALFQRFQRVESCPHLPHRNSRFGHRFICTQWTTTKQQTNKTNIHPHPHSPCTLHTLYLGWDWDRQRVGWR